jgi:hypothetical protein
VRKVPFWTLCLILLLSASSTAIGAAGWLARLSGRQVAVREGLHGNLLDCGGWRSRNPVRLAAGHDGGDAKPFWRAGPVPGAGGQRTCRLAARDAGVAERTAVLALPIYTVKSILSDG